MNDTQLQLIFIVTVCSICCMKLNKKEDHCELKKNVFFTQMNGYYLYRLLVMLLSI